MNALRLAAWTVLLLVFAGAGAGIWDARRASHAYRQAQAEAAQEQVRLRAELDAAQQSATVTEQTLESRRAAVASPAPPAPPPRPPSPPPRNAGNPFNSLRAPGDLLLHPLQADPQVQAARLAAHRGTLTATYGAFFAGQALDADRRKRFVDGLVDHYAALHDLELIREAQNLSYDDPALAKNREKLAAELKAAQAALLGEAGVGELQAYDRTLSLRRWVNGLAGELAIAGAPLSFAQGEALVQALALADPKHRAGGNAVMVDVEWAAVEAAARTHLTPAQLPMIHADLMEGGVGARMGKQILGSLREGMRKLEEERRRGK